MTQRGNVFILSVDSLQYRYFAEALTEIADQTSAVEFTNAVAPASHTSSAMPGLAAGVYPDSLSTWALPETGGPTTLAEALREEGYESGLWTDNYLFGAEYNYDRGFTAGNKGQPTWKKRAVNAIKNSPLEPAFGVFEWAYFNVFQRLRNATSGDESFYRPAEDLNESALDWLEETDDPALCWIHYMDPHHPYEPPAEYLDAESFNGDWTRSELGQFTRNAIKSNGEGLSQAEVADVATAYRAACEYLRDELTEFVSTLVSDGHFDLERDVFVLTADHGECLNPDQYEMMGHVPPAFWEEIAHVPLAISRPDWTRGQVDEQVSLIDLLPTILDAVDVPVPESAEGRRCSTPSEMEREFATVVSQWHDSETGAIHTYRGVRGSDGTKLFGSHQRGTDKVVLSHYEAGRLTSETAEYVSTDGVGPSSGDLEDSWNTLATKLQDREALIETGETKIGATEVDEEHLRNLGYME